MTNTVSNPVFDLPGGGSIRYVTATGALPAALAWPTAIIDPGFAMRIAGGPTSTNPGVWANIRFQGGSAINPSLLIGDLRSDPCIPHLVTALKQSGTQPVVLWVERAFRSFGLLPPIFREFPIPSGTITYDEVTGALSWPSRLSTRRAARYALDAVVLFSGADATMTLDHAPNFTLDDIRGFVADTATEAAVCRIDSALRHFLIVR